MKINPGRHNFQIVFRSTCHFQTLFLSVTLGERIHFTASSMQKISVCPENIPCFQRRVTVTLSEDLGTVKTPFGMFLPAVGAVGCLCSHFSSPGNSQVTPKVLPPQAEELTYLKPFGRHAIVRAKVDVQRPLRGGAVLQNPHRVYKAST